MSTTLTKGGVAPLHKNGQNMAGVRMELGWDPVNSGANVDLDASLTQVDSYANPLDVVYFRKLHSDDGSSHHTGDNLTGEGGGPDECIITRLSQVNPEVRAMYLNICSYSGQSFAHIRNAWCRVVELDDNGNDLREVCNFNLSDRMDATGLLMAGVGRNPQGLWQAQMIGYPVQHARTPEDMLSTIARHMQGTLH